ncbi:MAG TPA: CRTAC1 family protein [Thermoanaerobaculia bacterium]
MSVAVEESRQSGARPAGAAPSRRRRGLRRLALAVPLLLLGGAFWLGRAYPGMTEGMWHQMRYAGFEESHNLWYCVVYFIDAMESLSFDPEHGVWSFRNSRATGKDDLALGRLAFHRGDFTGAIRRLEHHVARSGESEEGLFWLAMSYMRRAEAENCLAKMVDGGQEPPGLAGHHHAGYCSLPLERFHDHRDDSRQAARIWTRLLDRYDPESRLYRWLLNFSLMTVDGFPAEVPARYRISTPFIDSFYGEGARRTREKYAGLKLTDRAAELGVTNFGVGRGVAVEDFDRDGHLDLVTADFFGHLHYYRNTGGRFVEATREVGIEGVTQPLSVSAADYDNDGWIDLFVVRPFDRFQLLRNDGHGHFVDRTAASGLLDAVPEGTMATSWFATWGDVDGDGDLDLFVSAWAFKVPFVSGLVARPRLDSKLFINDGNGHFHDGTADFGLVAGIEDRQFIGAAFGDYDRDGFPDLFLSGPIPATSYLYHNEGGKRFTRVELPAGFTEPGFTAAFLDINQDGRLDIFQGGFNDARTATARTVFGDRGYRMGASVFLLQTADGRFEKHPELFGGGAELSTMGTSYGDLDNDGCFDFYLGTGNPEPWFILPNLMFMGERRGGACTGRMENVSALNGVATVQKGHGIVFFDFNDDGEQDVFSNLGGMWPADVWVSQLFVNESATKNHWIKIRLRGRRTNYYGVGATIRITARRPDGSSLVRYREMDNETGFGSAPYLAHVGLLDAVAVEGVEVSWPASHCRATYKADLDRLNVLDEAECLAARPAAPRGGRP